MSQATCFFWNKYGDCKHGENCRHLHCKSDTVADPPANWTIYKDKGPVPTKKNTPVKTRQTSTRDGSEVGNSWEKNDNNSIMDDEWEKAIPVSDWEQNRQPGFSATQIGWHQPTVEEGWGQGHSGHVVDDWSPPTPKRNGSATSNRPPGGYSDSAGESNSGNRYASSEAELPPYNGSAAEPATKNRYPSPAAAKKAAKYQASSAADSTANSRRQDAAARYQSSTTTSTVQNYDQYSVAASSTQATQPDYDDDPTAIDDLWQTLLPPDFAKYTAPKRKYGTTDPEFEIDTLVILLTANPFQHSDVEQYLNAYTRKEVRFAINSISSYTDITALFFAVATNEPNTLKLLIDRGADVNSTVGVDGIPALAFAIMHGSNVDTTEMVRILLAHGADSTVIPDEFVPLEKTSSIKGSPVPPSSVSTEWCTEIYRMKLASTINITQRYWLAKARRQRPRTAREFMVARKERCQKLFQIPYTLIGQELATGILMKRILSHVLLSNSDTKPLVVVFAGASGHGKTELANCMGELLSADFLAVDSTGISHATDLFGPKAPFPGYEEGSALNNFLCHNHGQRSVVFLDDFEKMTPNAIDSLLIPFGEGKYRDRRTSRNDIEIDCSKVIWILATSDVRDIIEPYSRANIDTLQNTDIENNQISAEIEDRLLKRLHFQFGAMFAGRISLIIPFFPFSPNEQAIIAHKYILKLKGALAVDIDIDNEVFMGHIRLETVKEFALCRIVAEKSYDFESGARSIEREVQKTVHDAISQEWLQSSDDITNQNNDGPYERYRLAVHSSGEYIQITKLSSLVKREQKKVNAAKGKANGGVRPGNYNGRVPQTKKKPSARIGKLVDIGGDFQKASWE